jgi:hypothetical protein
MDLTDPSQFARVYDDHGGGVYRAAYAIVRDPTLAQDVTQDVFLRLLDQGYLYRERMTGSYSETLGRFLPDRYVEGVCPNCGGNFERRPVRPPAALERDPASTVRVFAPAGCAGP